MSIDQIQSILAAEIECGIFEKHVLSALETARKALAEPRPTDDQIINIAYECDVTGSIPEASLIDFARAVLRA
ncbi:hypothetical protein [Paraburkholderia sediminicola]|uniref:hypothetical protein n=1 Tax=Paraburkholderia sediminicola TaxID=458836 RepID=UPI0038B976C1